MKKTPSHNNELANHRSRSHARKRGQNRASSHAREFRERAAHSRVHSHSSRTRKEQPNRHPLSSHFPESDFSNEPLLLSRRKFLYGAIGVGALAVIGGGTYAAGAFNDNTSSELDVLDVPANALVTQNDFEDIADYEDQVTLVNSIDVPYGTLVWVNDDNVAACLLPTKTGSPLAQIGFLNLNSGYLDTVRDKPVGQADEYEIYDVRATSQGVVWTEANIMQGAWRIYTAPYTNGAFGQPTLVDQGDRSYEMPTLAAVDGWAFWQKIPRDPKDTENHSMVMKASFGSETAECLLETKYRNSSPLYADTASVVVSPRVDSTSVYHELTRIDASSGEILETLVLPHSVKPLEAGYGNTGFFFSFPDIYSLDGAIANLGTYTPLDPVENGAYSESEWFNFARTPTAAPMWAGDLLIVKSTYSVCGVNLNDRSYFAIDVENGADSFGEYLASTGMRDTFVTFTNIDHTPVGEKRTYTCRIKVWKPVA